MTAARRNKRALLKPLAVLGALAALLLFLAQGQTAHAATITVNTTADEFGTGSDCSLREAIQAANTDAPFGRCTAGSGADTITVPAGTYTLSITGVFENANASGDLDVTADLTINGTGAATTIIDGTDGLDRVFHIDPNGTGIAVEISGLTIQNGSSPAGKDYGGGGIMNEGGTLTLNSSTVSGNTSDAFGGGIYNQGTLTLNSSTVSGNTAGLDFGGILNEGGTLTLNSSTVSGNEAFLGGGIGNTVSGTATLTNSTVSGNTANGVGGGILNRSGSTLTLNSSTVSGNTAHGVSLPHGAGGGGIANVAGSTLTLNSSTVSGNTTDLGGGGIWNVAGGTATLTNSTVSGNSASGGGGILNLYWGSTLTLNSSTVSDNTATSGAGGGIRLAGGTATLTNSTVSGNSAAGDGGGIFIVRGMHNVGTLTLTSSTVSGNSAGVGGGIFIMGPDAVTTLKNTIVANSSPDDCSGPITSAGHNLDSDGTCGLTGTGDVSGVNPLLGSLANNGGPTQTHTQTHALLAGSPAIDAASGDCPPPATDQRGVARPQGAACDIGAFELVGPITSNVVAAPNPVAVGTAVALTANVDDSTTGGSAIASAEYDIDGGSTGPMSAQDGAFDEASEDVTAVVPAFTDSGLHTVCVRGADAAENVGTDECILLVVYDPSAGFVTGGGWVNSPAGADADNLSATGRANFGFVSKYHKGATTPDGNLEFQFKAGDLNFKSTSMEWLVVTGEPRAMFRGQGTINGVTVCKFQVDAWDDSFGGGVDAFGIKITACGGSDRYSLSATPVEGGSIMIHTEK